MSLHSDSHPAESLELKWVILVLGLKVLSRVLYVLRTRWQEEELSCPN